MIIENHGNSHRLKTKITIKERNLNDKNNKQRITLVQLHVYSSSIL